MLATLIYLFIYCRWEEREREKLDAYQNSKNFN